MEPNKSENNELIIEDQASSNGVESNGKALTMDEEVAIIHAAFERGKIRRAREAERIIDESRSSFMKLLFGGRAKSR